MFIDFLPTSVLVPSALVFAACAAVDFAPK
jgi:hypothetical protein